MARLSQWLLGHFTDVLSCGALDQPQPQVPQAQEITWRRRKLLSGTPYRKKNIAPCLELIPPHWQIPSRTYTSMSGAEPEAVPTDGRARGLLAARGAKIRNSHLKAIIKNESAETKIRNGGKLFSPLT